MTLRPIVVLSALAVAIVQSAVLGWMVWDRVSLLERGREVVLQVLPIDPRDLFRGDYVILNYAISNAAIEGKDASDIRYYTPIYVMLAQQADGTWQMLRASTDRPETVGADQVVMIGKVRHGARPRWGGNSRIAYGIEKFFVPEGKGLELEKLVREKKITVAIAVGANGKAALKGLMVDGVLFYREPLF
ncbi:MAG: GDYXXLXY domain-containing protein [Hyphomicrobiaceae bacterium]